MNSVLQDVRHASRVLRRTPAVTAVAVASLAVTIGVTAVVFTAVKAVLIEPMPYTRPGELVQFRSEGQGANWISIADMLDVGKRSHSFQSVGMYRYALLNLAGARNAPPEALYGLSAPASLLPALGRSPMLVRNILAEENLPGREREIILSYGLWTRRFNSDRGIVGRTVRINGRDWAVIGVMPPDFDFPLRLATTVHTVAGHMDFWSALRIDPPSRTG